jgi:hypothetical protein
LAQRRDKIVLRRRQYGPVIHLDSAPKAGKARGGKPTMHRFGGADQRLGRNAANIDTGAANRAVTDERHFRAQIGSGDRGGEPAEPAPMTATSNPSCPGRLQQSFIAYRFLEALAGAAQF